MKFFLCPYGSDVDPYTIDWNALPDLTLADVEARLRSLGYPYPYVDAVFKPCTESEIAWLRELVSKQREAAIAEFDLTAEEVASIEIDPPDAIDP